MARLPMTPHIIVLYLQKAAQASPRTICAVRFRLEMRKVTKFTSLKWVVLRSAEGHLETEPAGDPCRDSISKA